MTCDSDKLELYHDGELRPDERPAVEAHLGECAGCRLELDRLERLEALLLRSDPKVEVPAGYTAAVSAKARRWEWSARWMGSLAAALPLAVALWSLLHHVKSYQVVPPAEDARRKPFVARKAPKPLNIVLPDEVRAALERFAEAGTEAEREAEIARIRWLGHYVVPMVDRALDSEDSRTRLAAQKVLPHLNDPLVTELLLARLKTQPEPRKGPLTIDDIEPGEPSPDSLAVAIKLADKGDTEKVLQVLRPAMGPLGDLEIKRETAEWVKKLLKSNSAKLRRLGLDILWELDAEFPYSALVDLLGDTSEGVGDRALEMLKQGTGQDFKTDKEAWHSYFNRKM